MEDGESRLIDVARAALAQKDAALGSKRRAATGLRAAVDDLGARVAAGRGEVARLAVELAAAEDLAYRGGCRAVAEGVARWAAGQSPATAAERLLVDRLLQWGEGDAAARRS